MSNRTQFLITFCFTVCFTICSVCSYSQASVSAAGAWYWNPNKIGESTQRGLISKFYIVRAGNFNDVGEISFFENSWSKACGGHGSSVWLSHKVKKETILTPKVARQLALNINKFMRTSCFDRVELDIEPIFEIQQWHLDFFSTVRQYLDPKFKLDAAIEPPSKQALPTEVYWKSADIRKILNVIDGVDVMNYDTGYQMIAEYSDLIRDSATILGELLETYNNKQVRFGLPAYHEKTKVHNIEVENIHSALFGLKRVQNKKYICHRNFQFVYFEGGEMRAQDIKWARELEYWHESTCVR